MKTKLVLILVAMVILALSMTACMPVTDPTIEQVETLAVKDAMTEMNNQVGMPFIDDFYEKKMAKQIFEMRDNADLVTHAYFTNLEGQFIYLGKCVGYGLPYSVQYTNPEKLKTGGYSSSYWAVTLPQADPNGLYGATGLSATWLNCYNEEAGELEIMYVEQEIFVSQTKLPKRLVAPWSITEDY